MIKILFIINYIENSGPSRILLNIIKNLNPNIYDINLLTLKSKNDNYLIEKLKNNGVNIIEIDKKNNFQILLNLKIIRKMIKKIKPHIVHSHGFIPDILSCKGNYKKICTLHSNINEDYLNFYGRTKGKIFCKVHYAILKKFDIVCCCSKSVYSCIKQQIKNSTYIRNGIDYNISNKFNINRNELNIPNDAKVYIYSGRLVPGKRIVELIDMFKEHLNKDEYLLVVGTGPLYDTLLKYKSEQIRILGFKKNIYDYYLISDIYISNSASEGFSVSVIEALGCGLYLFLSDIPSHKECFQIDQSYYIGEFFNKSTFIQKKEKLIDNINFKNKEKLVAFQNKYLSGKTMATNYCKLYLKMIKNRKWE